MQFQVASFKFPVSRKKVSAPGTVNYFTVNLTYGHHACRGPSSRKRNPVRGPGDKPGKFMSFLLENLSN
jgi:hypothetical protein